MSVVGPSAELARDERTRLEELELVIERGLDTFVEVGRALCEVRDSRLYRESFDTFENYCHGRWSLSSSHAYRMIDAARVTALISPMGEIRPSNERQARELVPLLREDEQEVVHAWHELLAEYGDDVTAARVKAIVSRRLARQRRERDLAQGVGLQPPQPLAGECFRVVHGDIAELELEPASVDLVLTDPPYGREHLRLYDELGRLAARVLRPGGSLLVMTGQANLLEQGAALARHLPYRWTLSYALPGPRGRWWSRQILVGWKPVLWYTQGEPDLGWVFDTAESKAPDKAHHHWGQSVDGMAQLVERFSRPGELVLDPFLGGGTTAIAALQLGRRFLGCDVDETAVATSAARIAEAAA